MRQAYNATKAKLKEMEGKVSQTPQQDAAAQARIAELENQLQQLSPIVERANIEAHPGFVKQFEEPRQRLLSDAKSIIEMADLDPKEFYQAIQATGKARIQAIDELSETITSPTLRARLAQIGGDLERLDTERAAVINNSKQWKETADAQMKADQHRMMQQEQQKWSQTLDATFDAMSPQFELLREVEGNDAWNKQVAELRRQSRHLLVENTDPQQVAAAAVLAPLAPGYRACWMSERTKRMALEKELAEVKGGKASLSDGNGVEPVPAGDGTPMSRIFGELTQELRQ